DRLHPDPQPHDPPGPPGGAARGAPAGASRRRAPRPPEPSPRGGRTVRRALTALALLALLAGPADAATRWGWLGVRIRDLSEQGMEDISKRFGVRKGSGAVIVEVIRETPAAAAGLRNGDLVVAFRDRPVVDTRSLQRAMGSTSVGETVRLTVLRPEEGR